ncbi:DNA translocase FtsK [candidate division WS5 bacterium]|uniref:DNA translocase FtsK n=1 Tax=candidate division WS5 bacterium TaxID=2093353 RepID=A0A419DEL3_9BACT|nr:MAG: DNA translocase FtsK [candidate division WS5 bacterium]
MARHRKPGRPKGSTNKKKPQENPLNPKIAGEIVAVGLFILAVILFAGAFNFGGTWALKIFENSKDIFGFVSYVMPFILIAIGAGLFFPERFPVTQISLGGLAIFIVSLSGMSQIIFSSLKKAGGGGMIGSFLEAQILKIFNAPVSFLVFTATLVVGFLLATDTSLRDLLSLFKKEGEEKEKKPKEDIKIHEGVAVAKSLSKKMKRQEEEPKELEAVMTVGDDANWKLPSVDLLEDSTSKADSGNVKQNAAIIQETLSKFNIDVAMRDVNVGPTVTQYTLKPSDGVKLAKITNLDRDLALALAAHPIRIEAPIPGKSLVGVEIPNKKAATVRLKNILMSETFKNRRSKLSVVLGLDVSGHPQIADITRMPHLLIAGSTGSGKSVSINSLLLSLLYQNSPNELKMILVDPKRVELSLYNDLPHLLAPVIVDPEKTVSALKWAIVEMERRYQLLQSVGKRNISDYNAQKGKEGMPYIVIVIDELADIMAVAYKEVEGLICRLAQMARAVGIHLILATQRPSVDVITGLIKANITTRIAFSVASQVDSRTILDQSGAEKLLGNGDMLFVSAEFSKPKRIQGTLVSEKEVRAVTDFVKKNGTPEYNKEVLEQKVGGVKGGDFDVPDDDLFLDAVDCVIQSGKASSSLLQRRLRIGYARAARLLDLLEERGVVGPADGSRPRDVLVSDVSEIIDEEEVEA